MAYSIKTHTGTGSDTDFLFDKPYIKEADVLGFVDGIEVSISFVDPTTVRFAVAPALDTEIAIQRFTDVEDARHEFPNPSYIKSTNLDGNTEQQLFLHQEQKDALTGEGIIVDVLNTSANTGIPGSAANATWNGATQSIEFDIPRGDVGATGGIGDTGAQGAIGATGGTGVQGVAGGTDAAITGQFQVVESGTPNNQVVVSAGRTISNMALGSTPSEVALATLTMDETLPLGAGLEQDVLVILNITTGAIEQIAPAPVIGTPAAQSINGDEVPLALIHLDDTTSVVTDADIEDVRTPFTFLGVTNATANDIVRINANGGLAASGITSDQVGNSLLNHLWNFYQTDSTPYRIFPHSTGIDFESDYAEVMILDAKNPGADSPMHLQFSSDSEVSWHTTNEYYYNRKVILNGAITDTYHNADSKIEIGNTSTKFDASSDVKGRLKFHGINNATTRVYFDLELFFIPAAGGWAKIEITGYCNTGARMTNARAYWDAVSNITLFQFNHHTFEIGKTN